MCPPRYLGSCSCRAANPRDLPPPILTQSTDYRAAKPWKISFSYGRALQDPALEAWHGRDENLKAGQRALRHRASLNGAASFGNYTDAMEQTSPAADDSPHRRDWRDD